MRYLYLFVIPLLCITSCFRKKEIVHENETNWHKFKSPPRISYFDSTTIIQSLYFDNYEEDVFIRFYLNGKIEAVAVSFNLYDFPNIPTHPINRYNSFTVQQYPDSYATPTFWDSFYPTGLVKTKLVPDQNDFSKLSYLEFYPNGNKKSLTYFRHYSLDSLFVPFGDWSEYDSSGYLLKSYPCPENYVPFDFIETD